MAADAEKEFRSADHILDLALAMLAEGAANAGRLVDVPCGVGYLSEKARAGGWQVTPLDIAPEVWEGDDTVEVVAADLNERLPLPDGSADAVVCCEGIEHIENPWHVLREFRRLLGAGGQLVLSLPNTIDVRQRMRMLRRGYWGHYFPSVPWHINHMGTFALCHALGRTGFAVRDVRTPRPYGGVFERLLASMLRFRPRCGLPSDVCEMLSRDEVLRGRTVVIRAEAVPASKE